MTEITAILRGLSSDYNRDINKYVEDETALDTSIWSKADEKSQNEENKSAITVMLEDFAELTNSFSGGRSCITEENTKKGFFFKLFGGGKKDNVFKSDEAEKSISSNGNFYQSEIYSHEVAKNGGVKYANDGDNVYDAALNFANADIAAIEESYNNAYRDAWSKNGKLSIGEIGSYSDSETYDIKKVLKEMDLDGKSKNLSAEEYASYMLAIDGLTSTSGNNWDGLKFSSDEVDGLVSQQQITLAENIDQDELKTVAKKIYEQHYK